MQKAKQKFGETFDCREAGYILDDGTLLDLSGKNEGGSPHQRNYDHRELSEIIDTGNNAMSGTEQMEFFIKNANAIRFGIYGVASKGYDMAIQLNTVQSPTKKQWGRITTCCKRFNIDLFNYDIYGEDEVLRKSDTLEKISCEKAVSKLKREFQKLR